LFGDALEATIALSVIGEGLPLIYNGQEAGNTKRLAFFEKDPIEWRPHAIGDLYHRLFAIKKAHSALWNGAHGARMILVPNTRPKKVLSFVRRDDNNKVFGVFNLSDQAQTVRFEEALFHDRYTDAFSGEAIEAHREFELEMAPWSYRVLIR